MRRGKKKEAKGVKETEIEERGHQLKGEGINVLTMRKEKRVKEIKGGRNYRKGECKKGKREGQNVKEEREWRKRKQVGIAGGRKRKRKVRWYCNGERARKVRERERKRMEKELARSSKTPVLKRMSVVRDKDYVVDNISNKMWTLEPLIQPYAFSPHGYEMATALIFSLFMRSNGK